MYFSSINMTIKGLTCKLLMTKQKSQLFCFVESQLFCISFAHKTYTKTLQHKDTFITVGFFTTHFHINDHHITQGLLVTQVLLQNNSFTSSFPLFVSFI